MFTVEACSIIRDLSHSLQVQLHCLDNLFEVTDDQKLRVSSYFHHDGNFLRFSLFLIAETFCDNGELKEVTLSQPCRMHQVGFDSCLNLDRHQK